MLGYEALKERVFPGLTKWESHFATIAFAGIFAGAAGYFVARLFQKANRRLRDENAVRVEAEAAAKKALDEKAALLRELQHRAKNSFAMISSLIDLGRKESSSLETERVLSETGARVSAIAELYDMLYSAGSVQGIELGAYLGRIAGTLADRPGLRLRTELAGGILGPDEAIPIGLLVTELATNAVKHAFTEGRSGEIRLATRFEAEGLYLDFSDDGVGMPPDLGAGKARSLGLTLIRSLAEQLGGAGELGPGPGVGTSAGTTWRFRFPGIRRRESEST